MLVRSPPFPNFITNDEPFMQLIKNPSLPLIIKLSIVGSVANLTSEKKVEY
jgi:hypothetical protein